MNPVKFSIDHDADLRRIHSEMGKADPAYPIAIKANDSIYHATGLSKREVFAMAAMQGMAARGSVNADLCVSHADALIAALKEGPKQ